MNWKFKLVIFTILVVWCLLLGYIAFSLEWNSAAKDNVRSGSFSYFPQSASLTGSRVTPVLVMLASDENTMGGMIAAIHSISSNTRKPVHFLLVTTLQEIPHLKEWLDKTKLKKISYSLSAFPYEWVTDKMLARDGKEEMVNPMSYARFYTPRLFPNVGGGRLVYIDNDVIVQGDIAELANTSIRDNYFGAFSQDCESASKRLSPLQNTYASYINFNNPIVKKLRLNPNACSFSSGVFVANMSLWKADNLTEQLEHWLQLNKREDIYTNNHSGRGSQPPMMIVFYKRISPLDPMWHVRHLGVTTGSRYSRLFLVQAKLLHWDGHFKPWGVHSAHTDLWDRYYLPDPTGRFKVTRKKQGSVNS